jgi:hypothetical protein
MCDSSKPTLRYQNISINSALVETYAVQGVLSCQSVDWWDIRIGRCQCASLNQKRASVTGDHDLSMAGDRSAIGNLELKTISVSALKMQNVSLRSSFSFPFPLSFEFKFLRFAPP